MEQSPYYSYPVLFVMVGLFLLWIILLEKKFSKFSIIFGICTNWMVQKYAKTIVKLSQRIKGLFSRNVYAREN